MPDATSADLPPINYQALDRLVSRLQWNATSRPAPEHVVAPRVEVHTSSLTGRSAYESAQKQAEQAHEQQTREAGLRMSRISVGDLESQGALLPPEHPMSKVMQDIAVRIGGAEKRLQERGLLTRTETSDQYNMYVTTRDTINAWTYQHGRSAFFEAGFITMFDTYLREVKHQAGISQDHLAGLLAHEVSHTDSEAQQSYLNEEYCDAQGVILASEAGYNPKAMLDVEDFLIYLEKGADYYKDAEKAAGDKKERAFFPTHPPSENRRLVIINLLKTTEGAIPNQTRAYEVVDADTVGGVRKAMGEWIAARENRVLPETREACLAAIDSAQNETELAEAMAGYAIFRRAEVARAIAESDDFDHITTLVEAVTFELKEQAKEKADSVEFRRKQGGTYTGSGSEFGKDVSVYTSRNYQEEYKRGHIVVGGLGRQIQEPILDDTRAKAVQAFSQVVTECDEIDPQFYPNRVWAPYNDEKGRQLSQTERDQRQEVLNQQHDAVASARTGQLRELFTLLHDRRSAIDIVGVLSGDFSSCPELQQKLETFGVSNFNRYLRRLEDRFRGLDVNHNTRGVLGQKTLGILPQPDTLAVPIDRMDRQSISALLDETRLYRAALIVDARFGDPNKFETVCCQDDFGRAYRERLIGRVSQLAQSYSQTPEEQKLLVELYLETLGLKGNWFSPQSSSLVDQLSASRYANGDIDFDGARMVTPFESTLRPDFFTNRVAPVFGGTMLDGYITSDSWSSATGAYRVVGQWDHLGKSIDAVRVYHGEMEYIQRETPYGTIRYKSRLKPRDTLGVVDLITKRRTMVPFYQAGVMEEGSAERNIERTDTQMDSRTRWESLQTIAEHSSFERRHLMNIVLAEGVSLDEKAMYFQQLVTEGKCTYKQIFEAATIQRLGHTGTEEALYKEGRLSQTDAEQLQAGYDVSMAFLRRLPLSPTFQDVEVSELSQTLYDTKVKLALLREAGAFAEGATPDTVFEIKFEQRLFEGLPEEKAAAKQLDFIFDFIREGGTVRLSERNRRSGYGTESLYLRGMHNTGADVDILKCLEDLHYPYQLVQERVREVLELHKDRYTALEVDKWQSLIAFTRQPQIYYAEMRSNRTFYGNTEETTWPVRLGDSEVFQNYDPSNIDHSLRVIDEVLMLPRSTYRDYCLGLFVERGSKRIYQKEFADHPGREYYERRIAHIVATEFSDIGMKRFEDVRPRTARNIIAGEVDYIPRSERFINDPLGGFYIGDSEAAHAWSTLINADYGYCIRNPFAHTYRQVVQERIGNTGDVEQVVFQDRLSLLRQMPDGQMKEALTLYAVRSVQDRMKHFPQEVREGVRTQVVELVRESSVLFTSEQGRQGIFEAQLRINLGIPEGPISAEALRTQFPTRESFIEYVTKALPAKSAFRDAYIVLGVEAYPMKVSDAPSVRSLLFANDYGTANEQVSAQRAGLEFVRSIKSNEHITEADIREMLLWLVDEKRQVRTVDDFFLNITNDVAGRKLVAGLLQQTGIGTDEDHDSLGIRRQRDGKLKKKAKEIGTDLLARSLIALPRPAKRMIVGRLVFEALSSTSSSQVAERAAILMRSGMPAIIGKLTEGDSLRASLLGKSTFNSILEGGGPENPLKREMFFDLVLGKKGILEEPVCTTTEDFATRMAEGFRGSEMHAFIDDVMEIAFRNGKWDKGAKETARIVAHSFVEGVEPTRRATVLFNLLSELPKVDFSDPDKQKVRSRFLQVALSSIGVLGAKLGQIDELIPKGWGSEMSSLKHATKPMSKLTVADIFSQEGLSGDYVIAAAAGAASTACGYVVETPSGEEQFAKVVRPEVKMDYEGDFVGVTHMLECLRATGKLTVETGPVLAQIRRLVTEELQTDREIQNVVYYSQAETGEERRERGGIRAVEMPKVREAAQGVRQVEQGESLVILEELLPKAQFIELSKINSPSTQVSPELTEMRQSLDMQSVYTTIVEDFFHRAFTLGSWHSDLHDGNILVSRDGNAGVRRVVKGDDLVLIDFGQTGRAETDEKKANAARFFMGLALRDRSMVARAIHEATDNPPSLEEIERDLGINPLKIQERVTQYMAQHEIAEYLTNFLKASINVLPYLRRLPTADQFRLIAPYIEGSDRERGWIRVQEAVATRNYTRIFT